MILVHPSHRAYRADIKRSPGLRSQAAGANVLLWATSEGLLACLGHLEGCRVAGGLQQAGRGPAKQPWCQGPGCTFTALTILSWDLYPRTHCQWPSSYI